jgi:hypothetical protein
MRAIRSRIPRIERERHEEAAEDKTQHHRLMHLICGALVREQAGIDNVRAEHTEPETYRDIQETLAWAWGLRRGRAAGGPQSRQAHLGAAGDAAGGSDAADAKDTRPLRGGCSRAKGASEGSG